MKTIEIKFHELCEEIDYWKERAHKAEENADYWRKEYSSFLNQSIVSAEKGVAQALLLTLSVKEGENGDLIIDGDARKSLAETFKS